MHLGVYCVVDALGPLIAVEEAGAGAVKVGVKAIRAGKPSLALSNFDYASNLTESMLLGNVAVRSGQVIDYIPETGEIAGAFDHGTTGTLDIDAHRISKDVSDSGLSETGWSAEQDVFEHVAALFCGLDHQFEAFANA